MSVTSIAATLNRVDEDDRGAQIAERRTRLGLTVSRLAKLAGVDRGVITRLEKTGNARLDRIRAIEMALEDEARRQGEDVPSVVSRPEVRPIGDPDAGLVTFDVKGPETTFSVVLKGPVENLEELEASALRLYLGMVREAGETQKGELSNDS
jgi:transcriptional regulator with XRE-family HTH domain